MSIVTNVIVTASTGSADRNALSWINEQLEAAGHPTLMRVSDVYDSAKEHGKAMEALVAIGAPPSRHPGRGGRPAFRQGQRHMNEAAVILTVWLVSGMLGVLWRRGSIANAEITRLKAISDMLEERIAELERRQ